MSNSCGYYCLMDKLSVMMDITTREKISSGSTLFLFSISDTTMMNNAVMRGVMTRIGFSTTLLLKPLWKIRA